MNARVNGERVEEIVRGKYCLKESKEGFDACFNGSEIEIKACRALHFNGVSVEGKQRVTKGRFWIDNSAHKLLLELRGLYIFAVYTGSDETLKVNDTLVLTATEVNKMIIEGENTKIRYDRIFLNAKHGATAWA